MQINQTVISNGVDHIHQLIVSSFQPQNASSCATLRFWSLWYDMDEKDVGFMRNVRTQKRQKANKQTSKNMFIE